MSLSSFSDIARAYSGNLEVSRRVGGRADAAIILRGKSHKSDATLMEAIAGEGARAVSFQNGRLLFQFPDQQLAEDAENIVGGTFPDSMLSRLDGPEYVVDFLDPNLVKPLHIGHLRNIAVAWSLTNLIRSCGGNVRTQAVACDFGRAIGEAMAGVTLIRENEASAASLGNGRQWDDEYVGNAYAWYLAQGGPATDEVDPVPREIRVHSDLADVLLERLIAADPEVKELWAQLVSGAKSGQQGTLLRLGISIDNWILESHYLTEANRLIEAGAEVGAFRSGDTGETVYLTGLREYPSMCLSRSDGFPTQHLRALAVWERLWPRLAGATVIHVYGEEWHNATLARLQALKTLGTALDESSYRLVRHAHVTTKSNDKLGSSLGNAPTIASLLDQGGSGLLAAWIGLLLAPMSERLSLEQAKARGSTIADLIRSAADTAGPGAQGVDVEDPHDRFAVLQAYRLAESMNVAVSNLSPRPVVKWLTNIQSAFLAPGRPPSQMHVAGIALASRALGLPT